jgi:hypothetical protein
MYKCKHRFIATKANITMRTENAPEMILDKGTLWTYWRYIDGKNISDCCMLSLPAVLLTFFLTGFPVVVII